MEWGTFKFWIRLQTNRLEKQTRTVKTSSRTRLLNSVSRLSRGRGERRKIRLHSGVVASLSIRLQEQEQEQKTPFNPYDILLFDIFFFFLIKVLATIVALPQVVLRDRDNVFRNIPRRLFCSNLWTHCDGKLVYIQSIPHESGKSLSESGGKTRRPRGRPLDKYTGKKTAGISPGRVNEETKTGPMPREKFDKQ